MTQKEFEHYLIKQVDRTFNNNEFQLWGRWANLLMFLQFRGGTTVWTEESK